MQSNQSHSKAMSSELNPVDKVPNTFRETNSDTDEDSDSDRSDNEEENLAQVLTSATPRENVLNGRGPDKHGRQPVRYRPIAPRPTVSMAPPINHTENEQVNRIMDDLMKTFKLKSGDQQVEPQASPSAPVSSPPSMFNQPTPQEPTSPLDLLGLGDLLSDEITLDFQTELDFLNESIPVPEPLAEPAPVQQPPNQQIVVEVNEKMVCEYEIQSLPSIRIIFNSRRENGDT